LSRTTGTWPGHHQIQLTETKCRGAKQFDRRQNYITIRRRINLTVKFILDQDLNPTIKTAIPILALQPPATG